MSTDGADEPTNEELNVRTVNAEASDDAATAAHTKLVGDVVALRDRLSLTNIRMQRLVAEAVVDPPWEPDAIHVSAQTPEFRLEEGSLACRFEQSVELLNADSEPLARAIACAVVEFDLQSAAREADEEVGGEPSPAAVEMFVRENSYFIAYPYLRQAIHDLTARLGFDAVVLGVLPRGQQRPDHVALVRPRRLETESETVPDCR